MAGFRETFAANVDLAYGRGTRDITNTLERGVSHISSNSGGVLALARQAKATRDKVKDLNSEISNLKKAQAELNDDPAGWAKLQKNIDAANRGVTDLRKQLKQLPFEALEKGLGRVTKGLVAFNAALLATGLDFLVESIKRVYELQERWTKAIGGFNMRLGGMTAGLRGATKAATHWSSTIRGLTNGDINEGIQLFGDFTEAIGRTVEEGDRFERFGLQLARGFNLGGTGAGQLTKVLENIGNDADDATSAMKTMIAGANSAKVPVNLVAKDILESSTYMARFGKEGEKTFVTGAAWVRKYTITMNQLKGAVEGLDMFDEAAKTASKLNTAFGTMINSMDLMLEDDPAKRLEIIRQQFLAQGTTFDRLTPKQRRYLSETLKLTEDQTAALLDSKNANESYEEFQRKAQKREAADLAGKRLMERQLRATTQTMYAFGAAFDRITVAIANSIKPLLKVLGLAGQGDRDFKSFGEVMESITVTVEDFFKSLAKNDKWQTWIQRIAIDLRAAGAALQDWVEGGGAAKFVGDLAEGMRRFYVIVRDLVTYSIPKFKTLIEVVLELSKHITGLAIAWGATKAFNFLGGANGIAGKGIGAAARALGGGSLLKGAGRLGFAGAAGAVGGAVGGTGAGIGAGVGSLVGGAFGPVGMVVGAVAGGILGKAIQWLIQSPKVKTANERVHEELNAAIESETKKREQFTGVLDAVKDHTEAQDRSRRASNDILRSMDEAAAKSKGHEITLSQSEADSLRARTSELALFGKSAGANRRLLDSLGAGSKLTKEQLDSLLRGASAYEDELAKLRDTTKQQADLELSRLQVSQVGQQKDALELTTRLKAQELKAAKDQLAAGGGSALDSFLKQGWGGRQVRIFETAEQALATIRTYPTEMQGTLKKQIAQLELEAKIDKLDLDNSRDQKRLLGLQTDFLRQQTIIELKRAVMSDAAFLEFQRDKGEEGKTLDQKLVDFVNSGRSALGTDPYALGLISEGTNLKGLASGTSPQAQSSPIPFSSAQPVTVPRELNLLSTSPQASPVSTSNINVGVFLDGQKVGSTLVRGALTGRH